MTRQEPLRFTLRGHLFQIVPDYEGQPGYLGICDGRIAARAGSRAEVATVLINAQASLRQCN
jgi:hypothetical protein